MRPMSAGLTSVDERKRRFLFVDFLVRMWLLFARILLIFPLAVRRRRFAAPRLVFIFGISNRTPGARSTLIRIYTSGAMTTSAAR